MDNEPLGGDMAGDGGQNILMVDVAARDWRRWEMKVTIRGWS